MPEKDLIERVRYAISQEIINLEKSGETAQSQLLRDQLNYWLAGLSGTTPVYFLKILEHHTKD